MKITHVAIKTPVKVYAMPKPMRHHHILRIISANGAHEYENEVQGFLDEEGNFLDRSSAYSIALAAGQIDRSNHPPNHYNGTELFSEDLW